MKKNKCYKDKVPCRSLCEKLPRDLFSDTEYVWAYGNTYKRTKDWRPISRAAAKAFEVEPKEGFVPAPTVDELLEKFPEDSQVHIHREGCGTWCVCLGFPFSQNLDLHVVGSSEKLPGAFCSCYLQYRKKLCTK